MGWDTIEVWHPYYRQIIRAGWVVNFVKTIDGKHGVVWWRHARSITVATGELSDQELADTLQHMIGHIYDAAMECGDCAPALTAVPASSRPVHGRPLATGEEPATEVA
jgi:hypothetical protein